MKLTGECKVYFKRWYLKKEYCKLSISEYGEETVWKMFITMDNSFKYGVLVDFFDSVGINVVDDIDSCANDFRYLSKVDFKYIDAHNTRPEARDAVIEKANEIHNQR
ncbi:MAG: hypothetical protein ACJA2M_000275 [Polaribacter sp.]|jgi:hypothetical protein